MSEKDSSDGEEIEHGDATKRISIIDIDWDRVKATDLWMAFQSFLPPGGVIKSGTLPFSFFFDKKCDMMKQTWLKDPIS
jgi:hypothetical protein